MKFILRGIQKTSGKMKFLEYITAIAAERMTPYEDSVHTQYYTQIATTIEARKKLFSLRGAVTMFNPQFLGAQMSALSKKKFRMAPPESSKNEILWLPFELYAHVRLSWIVDQYLMNVNMFRAGRFFLALKFFVRIQSKHFTTNWILLPRTVNV